MTSARSNRSSLLTEVSHTGQRADHRPRLPGSGQPLSPFKACKQYVNEGIDLQVAGTSAFN